MEELIRKVHKMDVDKKVVDEESEEEKEEEVEKKKKGYGYGTSNFYPRYEVNDEEP